jgi:hypothetical protein
MKTATRPRRRRSTRPWVLNFARRKLGVAKALNKGKCGGSYGDACIIMGAVLSAIAAELWPGDRIDGVRFVELWACFSWDIPTACHISVPLLVEDLHAQRRHAEAKVIEQARPEILEAGYVTRLVVGDEVDMADKALSRLCPTLTKPYLRGFSYPCVFYREIRCGLVHEYRIGRKATDWRMTEREGEVSYSNVDDEQLIHFDVPWLTKLVLAIAKRAEPRVMKAPFNDPTVWWLDEGRAQPPDRRGRKKKRT